MQSQALPLAQLAFPACGSLRVEVDKGYGIRGKKEEDKQLEYQKVWVVAVAGFVGALIGALSGFAGSLLVYKQSEHAQKASSSQRRADIRREGYSAFVAAALNVRTELGGMLNFMGDPQVLHSEIQAQYHTYYVPANNRMRQAEGLVKLVSTESGRAAVGNVAEIRDDLVRSMFLVVEDERAPFDAAGFKAELDQYEKAVETFINEASKEVY